MSYSSVNEHGTGAIDGILLEWISSSMDTPIDGIHRDIRMSRDILTDGRQ